MRRWAHNYHQLEMSTRQAHLSAAPQQVGLQRDPMLHSAPALVVTISKQPGNLLDDNRLTALK